MTIKKNKKKTKMISPQWPSSFNINKKQIMITSKSTSSSKHPTAVSPTHLPKPPLLSQLYLPLAKPTAKAIQKMTWSTHAMKSLMLEILKLKPNTQLYENNKLFQVNLIWYRIYRYPRNHHFRLPHRKNRIISRSTFKSRRIKNRILLVGLNWRRRWRRGSNRSRKR